MNDIGLVRDTPSSWAAERIKEAARDGHEVRFRHKNGMLVALYYTNDGRIFIYDREFPL